MKHRSLFISLFIIFVLPFLDYSNSIGSSAKKTNVVNFIPERINYDNGFFQFLKNYDTIFILSDSYVEISLEKQTATVYRKKDTTLTFRISTGNKSIHKGMDTPEGIYTVQSKFRQAISKQFNNAKLFNWIGFNGNIFIATIHPFINRAGFKNLTISHHAFNTIINLIFATVGDVFIKYFLEFFF